MRQVNAPKSLVNIIEGESLLNDASSLIVFRFSLVAILSGQFVFSEAAGNFFLVIFMGIAIGLAVAGVFYYIHLWLPTTPSMDVILTLVTPYSMYYAAEHFHFSGVLAVVSGGLMLSALRQRMLSYRSRIEGINVWNNLVFVLNGLVFLLIGLQLPVISRQLEPVGMSKAILYGLAISLALIITRLATTFGAAAFTKFAGKYIKVADPNPGWKAPLIAGWAGMRGVVSLAAGLSIPLALNDGSPFPFRNLILFITFIVILVTLVLQGLSLPWLIRKIKPEDTSALSEHEQEMIIRKKITESSLDYLRNKYGNQGHNEHIHNLMSKLEIDFNFLQNGTGNKEDTENPLSIYQRIYLELLNEQRKVLVNLNKTTEFDEELIRKYLTLADIEELKIREKWIQDE
jgi:monovalent cation/hydrogen antiporter